MLAGVVLYAASLLALKTFEAGELEAARSFAKRIIS
jgi:hypothetical protein